MLCLAEAQKCTSLFVGYLCHTLQWTKRCFELLLNQHVFHYIRSVLYGIPYGLANVVLHGTSGCRHTELVCKGWKDVSWLTKRDVLALTKESTNSDPLGRKCGKSRTCNHSIQTRYRYMMMVPGSTHISRPVSESLFLHSGGGHTVISSAPLINITFDNIQYCSSITRTVIMYTQLQQFE